VADDVLEGDWSRVEGGEALTALARLAADQRAALVFRYIDDLPVSDVAALLDRSAVATESLLARARRELARYIEEARRG
jgi:RNA polymerase sigma-70 factor (ECF subfamily)